METINGETDNPIFDGMRIIVKDKPYDLNEDSTRWSVGDCNYGLIAMNVSRFYPADFEIQFEGGLGDSVYVDPFGTRVPFRIKNVTHDDEPPFRISDFDQDDEWDPNETISIRPYGAITDGPLITIRFSQDSSEVIHPIAGDIFHIEIDRPFSTSDKYSFTTSPSSITVEAVSASYAAIISAFVPVKVATLFALIATVE